MRRLRWAVAFVGVVLVSMMSALVLLVGPMSGESFALAVPPPTIPASLVPASTEVTTAAAVDTTVAVAGAEGAGAAAAGTVCAATVACAVVAVGVVGAAYGTYQLLHWAWGSHHVAQTAPTGLTDPNACRTDSGFGTTCVGLQWLSSGSYNLQMSETNTGYQEMALQSQGNFQCATYSIGGGAQQPLGTTTSNFDQYFNAQSVNLYGCPTSGTNAWFNICSSNGSQIGACLYAYLNPDGTLKNFDGANCTSGCTTPNAGAATLPKHTVKTDIACMDGSGNVSSHAVSVSGTFDDSSSSIPDTSATPCPNGTIPGDTTVTETTTGQPDTPLYTVPKPQLSPTNPCSAVGAKCTTTLQRNVDGRWVDDTTDTPSTGLDGTYRCEWLGPNDSPDGGPLPMTDCVAGYGVTDPNTGTKTTPQTNDANCWANGWTWNPVDWVLVPTKCALQWAFVPSQPKTETDVANLQHAWDSSPPGVALGSMQKLLGPFTSMPDGSGATCDGPDFNVTFPGWGGVGNATGDSTSRTLDGHPWSMCNPVGQWVHSWAMPFVTALVYVGGLLLVVRILARTIGADSPGDTDPGPVV